MELLLLWPPLEMSLSYRGVRRGLLSEFLIIVRPAHSYCVDDSLAVVAGAADGADDDDEDGWPAVEQHSISNWTPSERRSIWLVCAARKMMTSVVWMLRTSMGATAMTIKTTIALLLEWSMLNRWLFRFSDSNCGQIESSYSAPTIQCADDEYWTTFVPMLLSIAWILLPHSFLFGLFRFVCFSFRVFFSSCRRWMCMGMCVCVSAPVRLLRAVKMISSNT